MTIELNRLYAQQSSQRTKQELSENSFRKARTRTLIQIGSLCKLAGLLDLFNIEEGEDLQIHLLSKDKAAALLGFIISNIEKIDDIEPATFNKLKSIGIRKMTEKKIS